jgi:hypothetical protein
VATLAIETLTIPISGDDPDIKGSDYVSGDKDDNQIVTLTDGGQITGTVTIAKFGKGDPTEPGAGPGGDDEFYIDLSTFDDDFHIEVKSLDAGDKFIITGWDTHTVDGTIHTYTYTGTDGQTHTVTIDAQVTNGDEGVDVVQILCFVKGTLIATPYGEVPVEELKPEDLVLTLDHGAQPIRMVVSRKLFFPEAPDKLKPIEFKPGSLGKNLPRRALRVSPQHRILIESKDAHSVNGAVQRLVAAKGLAHHRGIRQQAGCKQVEYVHLIFDRHEVVFSEGVATESFYPGPMAVEEVGDEIKAELLTIFPQLRSRLPKAVKPARELIPPGQAKRIYARDLSILSVEAGRAASGVYCQDL